MKKLLISLMVVGLSVASAFDMGSITKNIEKAKEVKTDVINVKKDVKDSNYTGAKEDGTKVLTKAKVIYKGK